MNTAEAIKHTIPTKNIIPEAINSWIGKKKSAVDRNQKKQAVVHIKKQITRNFETKNNL